MSAPLADRHRALRQRLRSLPRAVVAFSGGVDSSFLALEARSALGGRAEAVTAVSESLPPWEREEARRIAAEIGIRHREVETREMDRPEYRANDANRCFFCKDTLLTALRDMAPAGTPLLLGYIADDAGDFRPGRKASSLAGALAPLEEAGLRKEEVRLLAREAGLSVWDKPALACLSSRVAYGQEVTPELLGRIGRAEWTLRRLGFDEVRVRTHGALARVEVPQARIAEAAARAGEIAAALRAEKYLFVTLDLEGLKSGSMNRLLT